MILKTALRRLYVRARRQQALDFRSECRVVLDALIKFGFPVRRRFTAVYALTVPLVHRRIFTASALALSIGRCATPVDNDAQKKKGCNRILHTCSPLYLLMSDAKSDSKKQCVQVVATASGVTSLKIHFRAGMNREPGGNALVIRQIRGANGFTTGFENTLAGPWAACCGRRCGLAFKKLAKNPLLSGRSYAISRSTDVNEL